MAESLRGWKLTSAICLLSSCVALSALPAARWSAAWDESAHLRYHSISCGEVKCSEKMSEFLSAVIDVGDAMVSSYNGFSTIALMSDVAALTVITLLTMS